MMNEAIMAANIQNIITQGIVSPTRNLGISRNIKTSGQAKRGVKNGSYEPLILKTFQDEGEDFWPTNTMNNEITSVSSRNKHKRNIPHLHLDSMRLTSDKMRSFATPTSCVQTIRQNCHNKIRSGTFTQIEDEFHSHRKFNKQNFEDQQSDIKLMKY